MHEAQLEQTFSTLQPRLVRLAYRMLGSLADAKDVVQEAWLRWLAADRNSVREPAAFLHTIVANLCLNELKSARRRRETYVGPWLPDPLIEEEGQELFDDMSLPLMIALERLSPPERAAFLLHDIFGMSFDDVALAIGRNAAACRKLASRAREHVRRECPRFPVPQEHGREIAEAFYAASRTGDLTRLRTLLADDVVAQSDGGGKVSASPHPLVGIQAVMKRHAQLAEEFKAMPSRLIRHVVIDGLPGFITLEAGEVLQTTALQIEHGKIKAIYIIRNPDKLRHVQGAV